MAVQQLKVRDLADAFARPEEIQTADVDPAVARLTNMVEHLQRELAKQVETNAALDRELREQIFERMQLIALVAHFNRRIDALEQLAAQGSLQ